MTPGGYRHAIDPFLLCSFVSVKAGDTVADLGTATGIIPLLLSHNQKIGKIYGVEIQPVLAMQAQLNVEMNDLMECIEIVEADIRSVVHRKFIGHESCDVVVSNPPYRKPAAGRVAPDGERASCRHELNGDIGDFLDASFYILRNGGRLYLIFLPERLPELLGLMREKKLEPKRLRCVHSRAGADAVMVLVEGRKNGRPGMQVEEPLYIYAGDEYSSEVKKIFHLG